MAEVYSSIPRSACTSNIISGRHKIAAPSLGEPSERRLSFYKLSSLIFLNLMVSVEEFFEKMWLTLQTEAFATLDRDKKECILPLIFQLPDPRAEVNWSSLPPECVPSKLSFSISVGILYL